MTEPLKSLIEISKPLNSILADIKKGAVNSWSGQVLYKNDKVVFTKFEVQIIPTMIEDKQHNVVFLNVNFTSEMKYQNMVVGSNNYIRIPLSMVTPKYINILAQYNTKAVSHCSETIMKDLKETSSK